MTFSVMERIPNLIFSKTFRKFHRNLSKRTLMTSSARLEKALEDLKKNEYFEKYAEKIAKLQQTSPEEFLSRVDSLEQKTTPKKQPAPKENTVEGKFSQLLNPKKPVQKNTDLLEDEQPLEKIMRLDLIWDKSTDEIKEIWRQYHLEKDVISAIIPAENYKDLQKRSQEFPTFLFPLPRNQGYEFIMSQFQGNTVHFTPLLYYQVHKENAPECLTVTHFTELIDHKGIVLMRGEYDKKVIDFKEAQCLANQLQLYYVSPSEQKLKILEVFTRKPDEFKHMDLIKQIESLSL